MLPEYIDYLGPADGAPKPSRLDGEFAAFFADGRPGAGDLGARRLVPRGRPGRERTYNTSLVFDRGGRAGRAPTARSTCTTWRSPAGSPTRSRASVAPGDETVVADVDGVPVGLSICYDLRFPELYRRLAVDGAQVIVVPAAFMMHTGRDHWEVLLRARAIENQCYVVAAGQIGDHEPGRTCFGRSMVIDPWGTVIAQAPDAVGIVTADLDLERLERDPDRAAQPGQPASLSLASRSAGRRS